MAVILIIILCAPAFLVQSTISQRVGGKFPTPLGLGRGGWTQDIFRSKWIPPIQRVTATSGGSMPIDSASVIPPVGVCVASDNVYEGTLSAAGELPFVGTVAIEGVLPTVGTGVVSYSCGNDISIQANNAPACTTGTASLLSGCGATALGTTATCGGRLPVKSTSGIPPVGVAVASENMYEGTLSAAGELPFVGTVGIDGILPTAGTGVVNYSCGSGTTSITSNNIPAVANIVASTDYLSPIIAPLGSLSASHDIAAPSSGCGPIAFGTTASSGGRLPVKSASAIPPVGVAVASENTYEGILAANGELPFLGTVTAKGVILSAGIGGIRYGCGTGASAMATRGFWPLR